VSDVVATIGRDHLAGERSAAASGTSAERRGEADGSGDDAADGEHADDRERGVEPAAPAAAGEHGRNRRDAGGATHVTHRLDEARRTGSPRCGGPVPCLCHRIRRRRLVG
jgi:hypothetical protein